MQAHDECVEFGVVTRFDGDAPEFGDLVRGQGVAGAFQFRWHRHFGGGVGGRGDEAVEFGESVEAPDSAYLTQAAEYSSTNVPFGLLLVLDLTSKVSSGGTWRLDELAWVATHRPAGATTDRKVMVGILPGNRLPPSTYSK